MAAELASTAQGLDTVVTQLASESWLGPTSAAMVAAVQPYVSWVTTTAGQAEHAAAQAQSAAAAFETVFASVVPPPLIAANRAELAQAVQTNMLGLNQSVIAQLEAQYAEFWAQNATAHVRLCVVLGGGDQDQLVHRGSRDRQPGCAR